MRDADANGATGSARVRATFERRFGRRSAVVARAPGRVNLIGEHTDYTGGFVLPLAIDRAIWVMLSPRTDDRMRMVAADFHETAEADPRDPPPAPGKTRWSDYVRGVAWALRRHGHPVGGFDAALGGNVPVGSGLSSSAALCVGVAFALAAAFNLPIDARRLALYARAAEAEFAGINVGIMDQLASALSVAGHALLIDCRSTQTRPVPLRLDERGLAIVVLDSTTPRHLARSAYNQRVAECREATTAAQRLLPGRSIASLRDLTPADLPELEGHLAPRVLRRARHVVTENARVPAAVAALEGDDFARLGELMRASHASLRDDYEVSTPELDLLVELAAATPGVLGARLTGAGFGGCTVNLVERAAIPAFDAILARYHAGTGREGRMLVCRASVGARVTREA